MNQDELFMKRAIQIARCGEAGVAPNPMVGAVIVYDGKVIGEGYHRRPRLTPSTVCIKASC